MSKKGLTNTFPSASMGISILYCCVILILCMSTTGSTVQQNVNNVLGQRIDEYVQEMLNCSTDSTAYSLAVVKDGKVILAKGYGYTSANKSREATSQTRFAIGSLTKAFTSILVSKCIHDLNNTRITLDTPIQDYLPEVRLWEEYSSLHVTLKDLLSHRVGTPGLFLPLIMGIPLDVTRAQLMGRLEYLPSRTFSFRERFVYNNFLYALPAYVMERMSNDRSWEELLKEAILDPLNMTSSGYVTHTDDFSEFALPFDESDDGTHVDLPTEHFESVHPIGPSGSIYSNAEDMSKWMNFLLSDGRDGQGVEMVPPEVISKTFEPVVATSLFGINMAKPKDPITYVGQGYGLGWGITNYRGYRQILHTGSIVTHSSRLWLYPDVRAGIFLSGNGPVSPTRAVPESIMHFASDILLGLDPWLNSSAVCSNLEGFFQSRSRRNNILEVHESEARSEEHKTPLETFTGVYHHKFFGSMEVRNSNGTTLVVDYGRFGHIELQRLDSDLLFKGFLMDPLCYINRNGSFFHMVRFEKELDGTINKFGIFLADDWAYFTRNGYGDDDDDNDDDGSSDTGVGLMSTWWRLSMSYLLLSIVIVY